MASTETQVGRVISAQDAERQRIASMLHDVMGHSLGRVLLELELLETTQAAEDVDRLKSSIRERVSRVVADLERLARGLHPPALRELGLVSGIKQYADDFERLHAIPVRVVEHDSLCGLTLPDSVAAAAFRVVQEGLLNVAMHARARHVSIVIRSNGVLEVRIEDDGIGLGKSGEEGTGAGLLGLRGRLAMLSGELELMSAQGRGTVLSAHIPLESAT